LKEHEAGMSVTDLCGKHDVSDASMYKWKAKFSEAKRLKTLEDENTGLKWLLADGQCLLEGPIGKEMVAPATLAHLVDAHG
jgi:putative transposase